MKLLDTYGERVCSALQPYSVRSIPLDGDAWPMEEKSSYIMERDTALELGGYPRESVNLLVSMSDAVFPQGDGLCVIGDAAPDKGHISYGKIVLLQTDEIAEESAYEFLQSVKLADIRLRFRDVMTRSSTEQFYTNLRVSKQAVRAGFSLERMGRSIYRQFADLPHVQRVKVVLLSGELPLYKELIPVAESVHRAGLALNTILDGIEMNCSGCDLKAICAEVEGLRKLHQAKAKK